MSYTTQEYAEMAHRASKEGKLLVEENGELKLVAPVQTLAEAFAAKIAEINGKYEEAITYLKSPYPDMSVMFWDRQCSEAREYLADNAAPALYIRRLAQAKSLDLASLARRILDNEEDWAPIGGMLEGQRQLYEEAAIAAETPDELADIRVSYNI